MKSIEYGCSRCISKVLTRQAGSAVSNSELWPSHTHTHTQAVWSGYEIYLLFVCYLGYAKVRLYTHTNMCAGV